MTDWSEEREIALTVNGQDVTITVPVRESLADALRDRLQLTGTHLGCEQGVCGSCTVFLDGGTVRSCTTLAVQADAGDVWTVEGLTPSVGLSPLQACMGREHGLQCGFCTPGILVSATETLAGAPTPLTDEDVREALSGNLCRCTGYDGVVRAVVAASEQPIELPAGMDVTPPASRTGEVTSLPAAAELAPADRPAPVEGADRSTGVPDLAAAVAGLLFGAILRRARRD